jgi:hypothetical protein
MIRQLALLIVASALLASPLLAQQPPDRQATGNRQTSPDATSTCSFNFSSGAGDTYLKFCVTANGNITQLETPAGHEHIAVGLVNEGYGICEETPPTAYWDYADDGDSANWGPASIVSQTLTSVKIVRTTSDGIWTLTQTITQDQKTPAVKIMMALKNNTAAARVAYLVRYADVDADSNETNDFGATVNGAAGWVNSSYAVIGYGLMLQNVRTSHFGYTNGFVQDTYHGPNPCAFAFNSPYTAFAIIDGSVVLAYVDSIGAGKTKTATMIYKGI